MPATFDAASAVIFLSAIGLLAVVVFALAAFVEATRREGRAGRPGLADHPRPRRAHRMFSLQRLSASSTRL
jgi:hypothetical protein